MVPPMEKAVKANPNIDLRYSHRATPPDCRPRYGPGAGAHGQDEGRFEERYKAKRCGIVLTTGGFTAEIGEMVEEYGPTSRTGCPPWAWSSGRRAQDGSRSWGRHAGLGRAVCRSFSVDIGSKTGIMDFAGYAGGINVNVNGQRFADESQRMRYYGHHRGRYEAARQDLVCYSRRQDEEHHAAHAHAQESPAQKFDTSRRARRRDGD